MFLKGRVGLARTLVLCGLVCLIPCVEAQSSTVPKWFISPPSNDETHLYGSGHGATIGDATNEALNQIASRLSVTVGSSFEKAETVSVHGGAQVYNKQLSSNITSKVAKLKFNNYEIVQNAVEGKDVFLLVAVDKKKLLSDKVHDLHSLDRSIKDTYGLGVDKSIIEKIISNRNITSMINDAFPLLGVINTLSPAFDVNSYYTRYSDIQAEINETFSKVKVYLVYGPDSKDLIPVVIKHLNDASIVISQRYDPRDDNLVVLKIHTDLKRLELYGSKVVKFNTNFEVKSISENTVAASRIESKGASTISFNEACQAAALNLDKKMKEKGIWEVLGIQKESIAPL